MAEERPRFRRDLVARPIEADGVAYVETKDPRTGVAFRFYAIEHAVAEAFDGRPLPEVIDAVRERSGLELTLDQVAAFARRLTELGFLENGTGIARPAEDTRTREMVPLGSALAATMPDADLPGSEPPAPDDDASGEPPDEFGVPTRSGPSLEKLLAASASDGEAPPEPAAHAEPAPPPEPPPLPAPLLRPPTSAGAGRRPDRPSAAGTMPLWPPPSISMPVGAETLVDSETDAAGAILEVIAATAEPGKSEPQPTASAEAASIQAHTADDGTSAVTPGPLLTAPAPTGDSGVPLAADGLPPLPPDATRAPTESTVPEAVVTGTLQGYPPPVDPKRLVPELRESTPLLFGRSGPADNAVTRERSAFTDEPASPADERGPMAAAGTLVSPPARPGPPEMVAASVEAPGAQAPVPVATPDKPLTEETAMPPVLALGWRTSESPAAHENGSRAAAIPAPIPLRPGAEATLRAPTVQVPTTAGQARRGLSPKWYAGLGLVTAAVLMAVVSYRLVATSEPPVPRVRAVVANSQSVYRFFDAVGTVKPAGERTLTFPSGGKVTQVMAAGSVFHPGDVVAELEGAKRFKTELAHHNERLAHYEKALEDARTGNDRPEIRQDEIKVAEKKRLVADAQGKLARQTVVATGSGELAEALTTVGAVVKPGAPAARTKGTDWRADFELSREDADRLRQLGFCHVEIDGKPLDCSLAPDGGDETHVAIDLPPDPAVTAGKPVRVARARYDGVLVLPASTLLPGNGTDHRVFVARDGRAESTAVILVDQSPTEIVVSQGLEPGSQVIVTPPANLRPRDRVNAVAQ